MESWKQPKEDYQTNTTNTFADFYPQYVCVYTRDCYNTIPAKEKIEWNLKSIVSIQFKRKTTKEEEKERGEQKVVSKINLNSIVIIIYSTQYDIFQ